MRHGIMKRTRYFYSLLTRRMVHLNFQILYSCNFRCGICDFWKSPYNEIPRITPDQVRLMVDKLQSLGPMIVSIGGGEPLLHPDLPEITGTLAKNHFPVMICNGWFVTPGNSRTLFNAGMEEVSVSLDYITPGKHDRQRGMAGAFKRAVTALKTLNENRVSTHQRVIMISVVMDDNLDDIEPLILLAKKLGVDYAVSLYSTARGQKQSRVSMQDAGNHLAKLQEKYPHFISLPGYLDRFSDALSGQQGVSPCRAGKNLFNIDSRGQVTLCIDTLDTPVGNIFTDDIQVLQKRLLEKQCRNTCGECWTSCRGSIETLMYGKNRLRNWAHGYRFIKAVPLTDRSTAYMENS